MSSGTQKVELPGENDCFLEFKDFEKQLKVPFVIYCDFETLNKKIQTFSPNPNQSSTSKSMLLEPCGFGIKIVCKDPKYTKPTQIYRGEDASEKLIECLLEEQKEIETILEKIEPMNLSEQEQREFETSTHCGLCRKAYLPSDQRDRHHDHLLGSYISSSHSLCNLKCKQAKFIPVLFHTLKGFDGSHFNAKYRQV